MGVDHPHAPGRVGAVERDRVAGVVLLADDAVLGISLPQGRDDVPLGGAVGLRHRLGVALGEALDAPKMIENDLAGGLRQIHGETQVILESHGKDDMRRGRKNKATCR